MKLKSIAFCLKFKLLAFKINFFVRYVPLNNVRESSETQKLKLQERMSGIKERPELSSLNIKNKHKFKRSLTREQLDPMAECKFIKFILFTYLNFFFLVLNEINERADWLAEMEELGEAKQHRRIIHDQIAERLRLIKQLEKRKENGEVK